MTIAKMTESEYRRTEGISRSELWKIKDSPEKFKYAQENPEKPTPAMIFGTVVHKLLLEPDDFENEFAIAPEVNRRTSEGRAQIEAFTAANEGKTIITKEDYDKATEMVKAARQAPYVNALLDGEHEEAIFWTDDITGEKCKAKLDCLLETRNGKLVIVDYKTTMDASTNEFIKSAYNLGYDFQAAMYSEAVLKETGTKPSVVFIAQEKTAPYSVNILQADERFVEHGYETFRELIGIYHYCKETGDWYGYLGKHGLLNDLMLPAWLKTNKQEDEEQ